MLKRNPSRDSEKYEALCDFLIKQAIQAPADFEKQQKEAEVHRMFMRVRQAGRMNVLAAQLTRTELDDVEGVQLSRGIRALAKLGLTSVGSRRRSRSRDD